MRKLTVLLLCGLMALGQVWAQSRAVTGKVTDEKGDPIAAATVQVKGTSVGVSTNADGVFTIEVPAGRRTLVISTIGYATQEVAIGSGAVINASLKLDDKALDEVVITGYTRTKKSTFAGAATVLSGKVVENVPVGAFDQALQGRAAGVQVQSASGQPGSSANIVIRGIHSIAASGAQPLYVIDGVPMPAFDMASINPNDFESMTVLKDANSTALYGSRGANGVIVITTKRGKAGQSSFTFRSQIGFTQAPNATNFDMMNTQEIFQYEERLGLAGQNMAGPGWIYSKLNPTYATQTPATQARRDFLRDSLGSINQVHSDYLFRQGFSQNYEMNMQGGVDKTRYFLSMAYFDQEGTDLRSRLRRYTTRFNFDHSIGKLNIQLSSLLGYSTTDYNEGEFLGNSARNPFQMSWRAKPYENPFRPDGSIIFGANTNLNLKQVGNVLEGLQNSRWIENQFKTNTGLTLSFKVLPTLTVKNVIGIDAAFDRGERGVKANSYVGSLQTLQRGYQAESQRTRAQLVNTSSVVYNETFNGKHEVEAGGYFETVQGWQRGAGSILFNLNPNLEYSMQQAGPQPAGPAYTNSASTAFGIRSLFAIGRYTYDDKYSFNFNVRRDGTSRILNPEFKEFTNWSVGATWNAIKEDFMQSQSIFTDLRVRGSYGKVPNINSIPGGGYNISGAGLFGISNFHAAQVQQFATNNAFSPNSPVTGLAPGSPINEQLKMEYVETYNVGVDFAMWNNRARVTVDWYEKYTRDLFVSQPLWATTGFYQTNLQLNAGTMSNKGLEFSLGLDVIKTRNSLLTFNFNHAYNVNNIEDMGSVDEFVLGTFILRPGLPFGSHYAYDYLGADAQTGRPSYRKTDGSTTNNISEAGLFADFGTYLPKHVGGFGFDYSYKGFSIGTLFSYQFDVSRYNNIWNWVTRGTPGYHNAVNASRILLTEQWQRPGDQKFYQAPQFDRGFTNADIQDAKFIRFRNLNVGYTIPEVNIGGLRMIKSAKFYMQMHNVWIWSPWKGPDPEDNNNISLNEFPNPRAMVIGLDINF